MIRIKDADKRPWSIAVRADGHILSSCRCSHFHHPGTAPIGHGPETPYNKQQTPKILVIFRTAMDQAQFDDLMI
jgi:hypothetical protein